MININEDELFNSVKEKMKENKKRKIKTYFLCALSVMIMLSGTAFAGSILQTVTSPSVGITAKVIEPISGNLEITLKSAPVDLDLGQTEYVKFTIVNNYPKAVRITPIGDIFSINGVEISNSNIQGNIVTSQLFLYNEAETQFITAVYYNDFITYGILVPQNSITVLRIPVTMPETIERGNILNLDLVVNVEEI